MIATKMFWVTFWVAVRSITMSPWSWSTCRGGFITPALWQLQLGKVFNGLFALNFNYEGGHKLKFYNWVLTFECHLNVCKIFAAPPKAGAAWGCWNCKWSTSKWVEYKSVFQWRLPLDGWGPRATRCCARKNSPTSYENLPKKLPSPYFIQIRYIGRIANFLTNSPKVFKNCSERAKLRPNPVTLVVPTPRYKMAWFIGTNKKTLKTGLPVFPLSKHTKIGKLYQMTTNYIHISNDYKIHTYIKWPQTICIYQMTTNYIPIPNDQKLCQMTRNYAKWPETILSDYKLYQTAII
jgi:hypothetical protein